MNKLMFVVVFSIISFPTFGETFYNKYSEIDPYSYESVKGNNENFTAKCGTDYLYNNNLGYCKALSYKLKRVEQ